MKLPDWLFRGPIVPVILLIAAVAVAYFASREPGDPAEAPQGAPWRLE